jgi:hypothetical protein
MRGCEKKEQTSKEWAVGRCDLLPVISGQGKCKATGVPAQKPAI